MTRVEIERCVEAELKRLCTDDDGAFDAKTAARFREPIRRNIENWEELRRENPTQWRRDLIAAYIARVEAQEDPSSVFLAEKIAWANERLRFLESPIETHGSTTR